MWRSRKRVSLLIYGTFVLTEAPCIGGQEGKQKLSPNRRIAQPARLIAKKATGREKREIKAHNQPHERCEGRIPVSIQPLDSNDLSKVAAHCNERKTAAKACSVSLMTLKHT